MPKLAANLNMLFTEVPLLERFGRAAAAGFRGVELLFPYAHAPGEIAAALHAADLTAALFNMPPGDWDAGERGIAALPGREHEFAAGVELALQYATGLNCATVHAMAGFAPAADERAFATYVANLRRAADAFAGAGRRVVIEPINNRDMPGYFLTSTVAAMRAISAVDRPNIALQLDLYHAQISEGDLEMKIRTLLPHVAHVQIAGNPARHEPDRGEVNYCYLLDVLDSCGYPGWVGCEYRPAGDTVAGLSWARRYLANGTHSGG